MTRKKPSTKGTKPVNTESGGTRFVNNKNNKNGNDDSK